MIFELISFNIRMSRVPMDMLYDSGGSDDLPRQMCIGDLKSKDPMHCLIHKDLVHYEILIVSLSGIAERRWSFTEFILATSLLPGWYYRSTDKIIVQDMRLFVFFEDLIDTKGSHAKRLERLKTLLEELWICSDTTGLSTSVS